MKQRYESTYVSKRHKMCIRDRTGDDGVTYDILYDVAAGKRVGTRFTVKKD